MSRRRALVVGAGRIGAGRDQTSSMLYTHIQAYQALSERVEVVGFVDRVLARAEWAAAQHHVGFAGDHVTGALASLTPDLVSICTPPSDRGEIVDACNDAASVRGIWCEKPYGLAAPAKALCQVNLIRRFDKRHMEIALRRAQGPRPADLFVLAAKDIHTVVHFTDLARFWAIAKERFHYQHFHGPSLYILREQGDKPGRYEGWRDEAFLGGGVTEGFMTLALTNLIEAMDGTADLLSPAENAIESERWADEILGR